MMLRARLALERTKPIVVRKLVLVPEGQVERYVVFRGGAVLIRCARHDAVPLPVAFERLLADNHHHVIICFNRRYIAVTGLVRGDGGEPAHGRMSNFVGVHPTDDRPVAHEMAVRVQSAMGILNLVAPDML